MFLFGNKEEKKVKKAEEKQIKEYSPIVKLS